MQAQAEESGLDQKIIGISIGDYNGIGPEVVIKALSDNRLLRKARVVIYGSTRILSYYRKTLKLSNFNYQTIQSPDEARAKKISVINVNDDQLEINPGTVTQEAGQFAFQSLERATQDLRSGAIDALVTAPINKKNIQSEEFNFPGHTEYLTKSLGAKESLMLMVCEDLRVGVATGHIPVEKIKDKLTAEGLKQKILLLDKSLREDFGIQRPRIAVMGLNPHAGEDGLLGTEEQELIDPVIRDLRNEGKFVYGPFSADGFFGKGQFSKYDGILAMYHDQGLVPFKTLASGSGINFTAGLSGVRTSPDHGTAYDIAGKGTADENSFRQAFYLALDICHTREGDKIQVQL